MTKPAKQSKATSAPADKSVLSEQIARGKRALKSDARDAQSAALFDLLVTLQGGAK